MTDDMEINELKIKTIDEPIVFSLRRLAQKENEYPAFEEYFHETRKLAAGERRQQNRHGKKVYFWHEDSEYVVAELAKLYRWAAFSSRTIDKNKISIWVPHYGSTTDDFKKAIDIAKGGILLIEETENFFLSLNEFLGLESSEEEKQTAIREGWKVVAEGLGSESEVASKKVLPRHTVVIFIISSKTKAMMTRPLVTYINTRDILEQKRVRYTFKQRCTVWQTLSRTTRRECAGFGGDGLDVNAKAMLVGDTIYALDAEDKIIPYADPGISPFDNPTHGLIIWDIYRGIAQFTNQGKWGYMDVYTGKIIAAAEFDYVGALCSRNHDSGNPEAYAFAKKNGLAGIINQHGEPIVPLVWNDLHWERDNCAAPEGPIFVKRNRLCGAVDMSGNILAPVKWRRISDVKAYLNGRKGCSRKQSRRERRQNKEHIERLIESMFF